MFTLNVMHPYLEAILVEIIAIRYREISLSFWDWNSHFATCTNSRIFRILDKRRIGAQH